MYILSQRQTCYCYYALSSSQMPRTRCVVVVFFSSFDASQLNQCYFCCHPPADPQSGRVLVCFLCVCSADCGCHEIRRKVSFSAFFSAITFHYNHRGEPGGEGAGWRGRGGDAEVYMTLSRVMPLRRVWVCFKCAADKWKQVFSVSGSG